MMSPATTFNRRPARSLSGTRRLAPGGSVLLLLLAAGALSAQPLVFTRFAGSPGGASYVDGTGSDARLGAPTGIAVDAAGNVYMADGGNNAIRRVSPSGAVTSYAGSGSPGAADGTGGFASFSSPSGIAIDAGGNLVVVDTANNRIRKVSPARAVTTLAGSGTLGRKDGTGWAATFNNPLGVALDASGNAYVSDTYSHVIRKVTPAGTVTTFAGTGVQGYVDGAATSAQFQMPSGIGFDPSGNLYVCDWGNNRIRKITPGGTVSTFAGSGSYGRTNGTGTAASFGYPQGIVSDPAGNLYVADSGNGMIRKISPAGAVTTFAGAGGGGSADGPAATAMFSLPLALAFDGGGNLYVADTWNYLIRKITPGGTVSTLASTGGGGYVDATGDAARFMDPQGAAVDASGNVYVADSGNHRIRKITPSGVVSTFAGSGVAGSANGVAAAAQFNVPAGIAFDGSGSAYVADQSNHAIRKISAAGTVSLLAGGSWGNADGTGAAAKFSFPSGVAVDAAGNVYVCDEDNNKIRKVTPAGVVSTLAGTGSTGSADGPGAAASFTYPRGIAVDAGGNVYVADNGNGRIRKITPGGVVSTLAGSGLPGDSDGVGKSASFHYPVGLAFDRAGNLLVTDPDAARIRRVTMDGVVTTVAGSGAPTIVDGTGLFASFQNPFGIAVAPDGKVYVVEYLAGAVRVGQPALADTATVDLPTGTTGQPRHLGVASAEGTAWQWTQTRIPTGSGATLSSVTGASPLFTPDVADTYAFRMTASHSGQQGITPVSLSALSPGSLCSPDPETLCLLGGRYQVRATYQDYGGTTGAGQAVSLTEDTGHFWFFDGRNVETVVKLVPFCGSGGGSVSIYAGGLTDVKVTLEVKDVVAGTTKTYTKELGVPFQLIRDGPFACP